MVDTSPGSKRRSSLNPRGTIRAYIMEIEQCATSLAVLRQRIAAVTSEIDAAIAAIQSLQSERVPSVLKENMATIDGLKGDILRLEDEKCRLSVAIDEAKNALSRYFVQ